MTAKRFHKFVSKFAIRKVWINKDRLRKKEKFHSLLREWKKNIFKVIKIKSGF